MNLLKEVSSEEVVTTSSSEPVEPKGGWNVGHLAHHGILLSCEGFSLKLDVDQLNVLFDIVEDGSTGEVRDTSSKLVTVEVQDDQLVLSRNGDEVYPYGVIVDKDTLKEIGIEQDEVEQPEDAESADTEEDIIQSDDDLKEGVKRAFKRSGSKIKKGWRVTSGFRKGRVVSSPKSAFKPRKKASTRMKLRIAGRKKRVIRLLKSKRTRRKAVSKRLRRLNRT